MKRTFLASLAAALAGVLSPTFADAQYHIQPRPLDAGEVVIQPHAHGPLTPTPGERGEPGCCEAKKIGVPGIITVPRFDVCYGMSHRYVSLPCPTLPTCDCLCGWQHWFKGLCCGGCGNPCDSCATHCSPAPACSTPHCGHVRKINVLMKRKVVCGHENVQVCNIVDAPPEPCRQPCRWNPLNWFCKPNDVCYSAIGPVTSPVSLPPDAVPAPEPLPAPQMGPAGLAPMPSSAAVIPATPAVPVSTIPAPTPVPPGSLIDGNP